MVLLVVTLLVLALVAVLLRLRTVVSGSQS
jgi:hypothetical protein